MSDENALVEQGKSAIKKMKPRGGNSPVIGDNGVYTEPGDNAARASVLKQLMSWGPVDKTDVAALERRFDMFVEYCITNDIRVTNKLAYFGIGISKDDVYNWENAHSRGDTHGEFIKKVRDFCATYREMLGADGKINPVTLVWWQKNYDGFVDKSEVVLTPNNPFGDATDPSQIAGKYRDALPPAVTIENE